MIVNPGTTVLLLKNVPLDNAYEHTIFFSSLEAQIAYFQGKAKYSFSNFTYQRVTSGVIKVGENAANLYDINYMMFNNAAFGNKWFYAFVTAVEYINNQCTQISYEIDVLQTWFFDYEIEQSFVERTHTATDRIGEHIEPESFDVGEYVFNNYARANVNFSNLSVIVGVVDTKGTPEGNLYDGIYGGATLWAFDSDDSEGINSLLADYVQKPESIVSIYMVPQTLINIGIDPGGTQIPQTYSPSRRVLFGAHAKPNAGDSLDGYVPHNCKMYTYPYCFFHVDNGAGQGLDLRYEFFSGNNVTCGAFGTITQPVSVVMYPYNYKGVNGNYLAESLSLNNFPVCSWNNDTFSTWTAQNAAPLALSAIGTSMGLSAAYAAGAAFPALYAGAMLKVLSTLSQGYKASIAADTCKGSLSNGSVNSAAGLQNFYGGRMSLNKCYAKFIDGAFDAYGYSVKTIMKPVRNTRPNWTYLKTIGCNLKGSVPADDMKKIISIYDNGCTWWAKGDSIGNYALNNLATIRG